jgi:hypothetical protein
MAIASVNAASSTATNWLKEAQENIAASANPGGLLGTLQDATQNPGSLKSFLAKSQNQAAALAMISSNSQTSSSALISQMAATAANKRMEERLALQAKFNPQQENFNPPKTLDPVIFFDDGLSLDTTTNIMTLANGTQIDTTTGLQVVDPASIIQMANGAYLNTSTNIMTLSDGTKIDTVTGLVVTA